MSNGAIINDCVIKSSTISGVTEVGGLIGRAMDYFITISDCYVEDGNVFGLEGGGYVGGLVGVNSEGNITNSYYTGSVFSYGMTGGLVGRNFNGNIFNCYSKGNFDSNPGMCGGLVGENSGGEISYCYSLGTVSATDTGGLVSFNEGGNISNCYFIGTVYSEGIGGGLIGQGSGIISNNSYSIGSVSGNICGGLVGYSSGGEYEDCYSVSSVFATSLAGGFIGQAYLSPRIGYHESCTKCFWDVNINPDMNGIGNWTDPNVIGKTTAEMQTKSTFTDAGWDFVGEVINGPNDIWDICEGTNYPKFVWQIPAADFVCPDGVTLVDFSVLGAAWYSDPNDYNWDPNCDISEPNDGVIDEKDLRVFSESWLGGI